MNCFLLLRMENVIGVEGFYSMTSQADLMMTSQADLMMTCQQE